MSRIDAEIGLKTGALQAGLHRARGLVDGFKKSANSALGGAIAFATSPLTAGLAALGGALSVGALAFKAFNAAADQETRLTSFSTMLGSAEAARKKLEELNKFADVTPFEPGPVIDSARALMAFGVSADEVIPTLTRVGDVASGVNAPLGELAEIYGKARVQGTLFAEDINQLTGRGIPVIQEFAKQLGVSEGEVKKLASEGKISFKNLEQAFKSLTGEGGKFAGMMDAQSRTTAGLISTIKGKVDGLFRAFGEPVNDALKPLLEGAAGFIDKLAPAAQAAGKAVGNALRVVAVFFQAGQIGELIRLGLSIGFGKAVNFLVGGLQFAVSVLTKSFTSGGMQAALEAIGAKLAQIFLVAFESPIKGFQAGLQFAVEHVMEFLGTKMGSVFLGVIKSLSPILGAVVGQIEKNILAPGFKARSFEEIKASTTPTLLGKDAEGFGKIYEEQLEKSAALNGQAIADTQFRSAAIVDTDVLDAEQARLAAGVASALKIADQQKAAAAAKLAKTGAPEVASLGAAAGGTPSIVADSLRKIGGGGNFVAVGGRDPLLAENQKQTEHLRAIQKALQAASDYTKDPMMAS